MDSFCKCGTRVWREYRWNGLATVAQYYRAEVLASAGPINGFLIDHCPGCGEQLREDVVFNHCDFQEAP